MRDDLESLQVTDLKDLSFIFMQLFSTKSIDQIHQPAKKLEIDLWIRSQLSTELWQQKDLIAQVILDLSENRGSPELTFGRIFK